MVGLCRMALSQGANYEAAEVERGNLLKVKFLIKTLSLKLNVPKTNLNQLNLNL